MSYQPSQFTYDNLLLFNSSSVKELLNKISIDIKIQELRINFKKKIQEEYQSESDTFWLLNSKKDGIMQSKRHFSNPRIKFEKAGREFDQGIIKDESRLVELKNTRQRITLDQSLRGESYGIFSINEVFVFNVQGFPVRPSSIGMYRSVKIYDQSHGTYWTAKISALNGEKSRLETSLSNYRNVLQDSKPLPIIPVTVRPPKPPMTNLKPLPITPVTVNPSKPITQDVTIEQIQSITFSEQVNSGDFNETPITDVNLSSGCSECTETNSVDPIPEGVINQGYMKMAGIAAIGLIGLLVLKK